MFDTNVLVSALLFQSSKPGLAVNGRAGAIITGDADLLALNPFRGIPIVTPAEFLRDVG